MRAGRSRESDNPTRRCAYEFYVNFCTVRKWVGLQQGRKKKVHAHTFLSAAALLYVLLAHLSVAVVSAAQRELPSIRPSDLPFQHTRRRTKRPSGSAAGIDLLTVVQHSAGSRRRRSHFSCLPLDRAGAGPCSSFRPRTHEDLRPPEVLYMMPRKCSFTKEKFIWLHFNSVGSTLHISVRCWTKSDVSKLHKMKTNIVVYIKHYIVV